MKNKIVIKLGGSALQNPETLKELAALVLGYQKKRFDVVVVHGGGPAINEALTNKGIQWNFIEGQRQTTHAMMEVIEQVLARDINSMLVSSLKDLKVSAVGLSGSQFLLCEQANPLLLQVGKVVSVDPSAIDRQVGGFARAVPVIAPIGIGSQGDKYNINADWAATQIAIAVKAKKLIFLTDQLGVLDANRDLIPKANPSRIEQMIDAGSISGGMCAKVRAMTKALEQGVKQVQVLHASQASQLLLNDKMGTLLTDQPLTKKEVRHGRAS